MYKIIFVLFFLLTVTLAQYNKTESIQFAYYSALTYCTIQQLSSWNCKVCDQVYRLTDVSQFNNTLSKIVGFIGYHQQKQRIIVSWRGTDNAINWFQDFNFEEVSYKCKDCWIHLGFLESYNSVKKEVSLKAKQLITKYPQAKIYVTGQSLGGALSTLSALQLQLDTGKVIELHNFGSPRIGNVHLAQFINTKIPIRHRVVHNRDIVPHLPPLDLATPYHHISYQVLYTEGMQDYRICDDSGEDKSCSNKFAPNYSFSDHDGYWVAQGAESC